MNGSKVSRLSNQLVLTLFMLLAGSIASWAQLSEGGIPASFNTGTTLRSTPEPVNIPITFNVEDLKLVDEWQVSQGAPLRLATIINTTLTIEKDGHWFTLNNNLHVWQLRVKADNAIALMIFYNKFRIPETGKLFIYNADKTHILGAYTHITHTTPGKFATEFIAGDDIIFEYETTRPDLLPELEIEGIGYGYNHLSVSSNGLSTRASAGSCMVNINCEEGDNWQDVKNGVCRMAQKIGSSVYICSGALINNTAQDYAPYIITAYHCSEGGGQIASQSDYSQWMFYFHYEREGCSNNSNISTESFSMVGCKQLMASSLDAGSDGMLLLLNQEIPAGSNVYFNGWDRGTTIPGSGVGIHHPQGDVMKISTYTTPLTSMTWNDEDGNKGATNAHWNAIFAQTTNGHGVTEGGSSGSPLYNSNKLVVGTLSGGSSVCGTNPSGYNLYGKLSAHWNNGMSTYLDPDKTNTTILTGMYGKEAKGAPANLKLSYRNGRVLLSWNAPGTGEKPVKYKVYKNSIFLDETSATSFTDEAEQNTNIMYAVSAVYQDGEESAKVSNTIMITDYKRPTNVNAELRGWSAYVSWQAPVYEQTAYWGNWEDSGYALGFSDTYTPFYFGQAWHPEDLQEVNNKTITQVRFFAQRGVSYTIYIRQGQEVYQQRLSNISTGQFQTIQLTTPFTINSSERLIVSLYATGYGSTNFPAVIDKGPVVNGKGNLISSNGQSWETVNEDANFMVSMTISSEENKTVYNTLQTASEAISTENIRGTLALQEREKSTSIKLSSQPVAAFPEVTTYNIYRDSELAGSTSGNTTEFIDYSPGQGTYSYSVSALYGDVETDKTRSEKSVSVDNEKIATNILSLAPTLFIDQVTIISSDPVIQVEVFSIDGKKYIHLANPENAIPTGNLPAGVYLFRIHTNKEVKTIKGVKQN